MKRHPQFAFLSSSGLVVLIVLLVLSYQLALLVRTPDHQWLTVTKSETQQVQCSDPTKPLTEWREVRLPHWENGIEMGLHCLRMRTTLTGEQLSASRGPTKLMVNTVGSLGRIRLNGEVIDEIIHSTPEQRVLWFRPYSIVIPDHLVRDSNRLELDYYNYKSTFQISQIHIGHEPLIESRVKEVTFITKTTMDGITILMGFVGCFLFSFSMLYNRERLIGLAGRTMFACSALMNLLLMGTVGTEYHVIWAAFQFAFVAMAINSFVDFCKIIAEAKSNPFLTRCRFIYSLSGFFICLIGGAESIPYLEFYWVGGVLIYFLFMMGDLFVRQNLLKKPEGQLLVAEAVASLVLAGHDFLITSGKMGQVWVHNNSIVPAILAEEIILVHYGFSILLAVMGLIVFNRYRIAQRYEKAEATRLSQALQHSEKRMREVMQKQQAINNVRLIQSERERLLMEIHDGVGSQLISGMLLANKQEMSRAAMLDLFQTCMDDVKVIIDCISLGQPTNAAIMIGALLERQRQRLAGLGIVLHFKTEQKSNATHTEISDAQCLHACRIVQECIANAIKYAQCSAITVTLRQYQDHLLVVVRDNGRDFAPTETVKLGRGLQNMRKRARLLSGQIRFLSQADGFRVMLRFRNATPEEWKQAA